MSDKRKLQLAAWIGVQLSIPPPSLEVVSGDASFRRYFRFNHQQQSIIAVDAPPEQENNQSFWHIGEVLAAQGILVPQFLKVDLSSGFLLISDLGDQVLLANLTEENVDDYYRKAIDNIIALQQIDLDQFQDLPPYDAEFLSFEMSLFNDWFIHRHLNLSLTDEESSVVAEAFAQLTKSAVTQPQRFVHRDFHSRNLMLVSQQLAIIDFQDARVGPLSYDLVSLLKDCYISWSEEKVRRWADYYYQNASKAQLLDTDSNTFFRQFEWMGMQRHIKVLGIFCRLNYRDNKPCYLQDLPLTFDYLLKAAERYDEFEAFTNLLKRKIRPALESKQ